VRVQAARTRQLGNPVARLFAGLTGESGGDAVASAEASLSNLVAGVRPFAGAPVPVLPLVILERDPGDRRSDTWEDQVESGRGPDEWAYDSTARSVIAAADGLSELALHPAPPGEEPGEANVHVLSLGNGLDAAEIARQVRFGWSVNDLADYGGEFLLDGEEHELECSAGLDDVLEPLERLIGQKRLALVYELYESDKGDLGYVVPTRFVAVRVMAVDSVDGQPRIIVQPTVLATRTVLPPGRALSEDEAAALTNSYVYKVTLTN
jgi:hypothetical protein